MKKILGLWVLYLGTSVCALSQVDTSFIYNRSMPYGTLDLRISKSSTRYYYLRENVTFSYRESAPGVRTNTYRSMTTWNTSAYGEGHLREKDDNSDDFVMNYRLLKPQNYRDDYSPGYPIILMLHGGGEAANCWIDTRCKWATPDYHPVTNIPPAPTDPLHELLNNDRNLLHGGAQHLTAVNLAGSKLPDDPTLHDRAFPGFVLFPQSLNGWTRTSVQDAIRILRLIIKKYNIDENRVYIHGLSNGGGGVYVAIKSAPWLFAAALPMSAVYDGGITSQGLVPEVAKIPLWIFQGGQDINPTPSLTYYYIRKFRSEGASVRYYLYPNLGHGTWNTAYKEPDFFSWMLEKRKYNPHVAFGNATICNTTQTGAKLAFSKGFLAYQWQRDGKIIPEATSAELIANTPGSYRGRFSRKRNPSANDWEPWSDPIVVSEINPDPPSVKVLGTAHLRGPGLASSEENNSVQLKSADTASFYLWYKNGALLTFSGTDVEDTLRVATFTHGSTGGNGAYTLVTKSNNCPSPPSEPLNLFFNNSSPLNITLVSDGLDFNGTVTPSSIFLSWNDISLAESGYEIWRRREGTSDFKFVTKTPQDAVSFHDVGLDPGTTYDYKLRAVNNNGRSNYLPSDDLNVNYTFKTAGDQQFPPAPQNLKVVSNTLNTITLSWKASEDESSIKSYYVYYNNDSVNTETNATTFTLTGLSQNRAYRVTVRALDYGDHLSQPSNQVIATTYVSGLVYKHSTGAWETLDDPSLIATFQSPEFTGTVPNFTLQPRTQEDYFNFQFTGYLNIETEGTYYFNISSSDGSRLILDGKLIADNDGLHGTRTVESEAIHLKAGPHAIEVQYFDDVGSHTLTVRYRGPGVGDGENFVAIPEAALRSGIYIPPSAPSAPKSVSANGAGVKLVNVSWQYDDNGQTDFEVYRARVSSGPYEIVARVSGTSAVDSIGLLPGTQYYYRVKTVSNNGTSSFSNTATATTSMDKVAPSVPANLVLISKTLSNLAFSWDPSTDDVAVTEYEVFLGDRLIGTSPIHAFTADGLSPNTEYSFTVRALDASGNRSAASAPLLIKTTSNATFYSLPTGNLNELSSWGRNEDGTGDTPPNFSDNGQFFVVTNRTSTTLGGSWTVEGGSSRIIVPAGVTLTVDSAFSGNVELEGNAVLNLGHSTAPTLVRLSPESTVNFVGYPTIEANSYGNIIVSGSTVKTFDGDTIDVRGNLTVHEGVALKGAPQNSSFVRIGGNLTLLGTRPMTAADNAIDLVFTGATAIITTDSDLDVFRITTAADQTITVANPQSKAVNINLGSLKGGGLFLADGSVLDMGNHNMNIAHAAVINPGQLKGALSANGGNLAITSTSAQSSNLYFTSANIVNRLTIGLAGSVTATVRSPLQIIEGIKITNGTLASEGKITLLATAERSAVIHRIENNGRITGDVTVQQHLPSRGNVLAYLSAPTSAVTVAEWQESFPITGPFTGSSPGSGTDHSLFYFDAVNERWAGYPRAEGSNTAPIERATGYAARLTNTDQPITLTVTGNPYQGNIAFKLSDGDGGLSRGGWNLVGNPYASPVVWSAAEGAWTRSGVSSVIAIRKDTTVNGAVRSQVTYHDITTGDGVIPAGQAFWVRTFNSEPSLSIHEKAKVDTSGHVVSPADVRQIVVSLRQGDVVDAAYILFTDEATDGFDPPFDGRKLRNGGMFNLSTITGDTVSLAVNSVARAFCSKTIALNIADVTPGSYSLAITNLESFPDVGLITLIDHFAGTSATVSGAEYNFTVTEDPASYGRSRFALVFEKDQLDLTTPKVTGGDICAPGPGAILVSASQPGALYQVIDDSGKVISDFVEGNGEDIEIPLTDGGLTSGSNKVSVTAGFEGCERETLSADVTLTLVTELTITAPGDISMCEGGDITLEASGAPVGGFYKWYDGEGVPIEGAAEDTLFVSAVMDEAVYYVSAAHPDGCESGLAEIHIYTDSLDMPVILVREDTIYTDVVGYYQWRKDGADIPGATLSYYVPEEEGAFTVMASNGGCYKESEPYEIGPVTGIQGGSNPEFVLNIYPVPSSGSRINVLLRSPKTDPVLIEIIDAMGRLHFSRIIDAATLMQGTDLVPSSPLYNGIYFLRATQSDIRERRKIIVKN